MVTPCVEYPPAPASAENLLSLLSHGAAQHASPINGRSRRLRGFYESLPQGEAQLVDQLWALVTGVQQGDPDRAKGGAERLLLQLPLSEDSSSAATVHTFLESLVARASHSGTSGGNLYLEARPPGAQLRAFELMRLRTPLIAFAYAAANRAILDVLTPASTVTLIDLGIGRGGQIRTLLRNPAARQLIGSLHVVGVEPDSAAGTADATENGALQAAEESLRGVAAEIGIPFSFVGIPKRAETLSVSDLRNAGLRGIVLANASLALHHVPLGPDPSQGREAVLRMIRACGAEALVLVEPDTDHYEESLPLRFLNAYCHYRTVSRSLWALLSPSDASTVWSEFFAPEIRNVVAHDLPERSELHEESERWEERLLGAGWGVDALNQLLPQAAAPPGFQVRPNGRAFSLSYRDVDLLSVLRARRG